MHILLEKKKKQKTNEKLKVERAYNVFFYKAQR